MTPGVVDSVLLDVGGTLRPNAFVVTPALQELRARAVSSVLGCDHKKSASIVEMMDAALGGAPHSPPDLIIARVLAAHGYEPDVVTTRRARQSLCAEVAEVLPPFAHAGDFLSGVKRLGFRCVVLSNTTFCDAEMYQLYFGALGWAPWVDSYVTSVDVGWSKPDERIFRVALDQAGSRPDRCVMVGNSEDADITPAVRLGMRAILVAIEDPVPSHTAADICVTSLDQALEVLQQWGRH